MKVSVALLTIGLLATASAHAGEVKLAKTHICCAGCVTGIEEALAKVEGVSNVKVDQDAKSVTFDATDAKIGRQGVRALANAGFGGEATHAGKAIILPTTVEAGTKANEVKLTRLHLCCGACVKAVEGAVTAVSGVESAKCDKDKGTCTVTGTDVVVVDVLKALQDAGFNGTVPGPKGAGNKNKKKKTDN